MYILQETKFLNTLILKTTTTSAPKIRYLSKIFHQKKMVHVPNQITS